jgi:cold shock protein
MMAEDELRRAEGSGLYWDFFSLTDLARADALWRHRAGSWRRGGAPGKKGGLQRMAQGTVKWFNDEKGYGFISPDESGEDLFVHHTGIAGSGFKSLEEGAKVEYEATRGKKGMQAESVDTL